MFAEDILCAVSIIVEEKNQQHSFYKLTIINGLILNESSAKDSGTRAGVSNTFAARARLVQPDEAAERNKKHILDKH